MSEWVRTVIIIAAVVAGLSCVNVSASQDCGNPFVNGYGPFDYTNPDHFNHKLNIVETHHFTKQVVDGAMLIGPKSKEPLFVVGALDYTLRAFPNHHPALMAMGNYMYYLSKADIDKYKAMTKQFRTPECYFQRAMEFKPDDAYVYMIYGIYLFKKNELKDALQQLKKAEEIQPENSEIQYNMGLIYFKEHNIKLSVKHAKKAYSLGYPLPYLRDQLKKLGKWQEQ